MVLFTLKVKPPVTVPVGDDTTNRSSVIVSGLMASLNLTTTPVFSETFCALFSGVIVETTGGVLSVTKLS